jgi:hypothetical protein
MGENPSRLSDGCAILTASYINTSDIKIFDENLRLHYKSCTSEFFHFYRERNIIKEKKQRIRRAPKHKIVLITSMTNNNLKR